MSDKDNASIPNVRTSISGAPYPIKRKELIEYARNKGANTGILDLLEKLPDEEFSNEAKVIENLEV